MTGKFCLKLLPSTSYCWTRCCLQLPERLGCSVLDWWGGGWSVSRLCRIWRIIWLPLPVILFWSNLECLESVVLPWSHCDFDVGPHHVPCSTMEQLCGSGHTWEQKQKLQPCHNLPSWRDDVVQESAFLAVDSPAVTQGFCNLLRGYKDLLPTSLWGEVLLLQFGYGFLAEVKAVSEWGHLFPLSWH